MTTIITFKPDPKAFAKAYAEFKRKKEEEKYIQLGYEEDDTISGDMMRDN